MQVVVSDRTSLLAARTVLLIHIFLIVSIWVVITLIS